MSSPEDPRGPGVPGSVRASSPVTLGDRLRNLFGGGGRPPLPPVPAPPEAEEEEEGMLRMSFLEHLEELRSRIIKSLVGIAVAGLASFSFAQPLWEFVRQPARVALLNNGYPPNLTMIDPMEGFNILWFKLPLVCAVFLASPWVLYQVWAFISPGLYRREKRWAVPFVLTSAGLFIMGGLFGYFVAFRFGLTFLLGIGRGQGLITMVTVTRYFDLFVNVILGVGLVFELPVVIFFLILFHIATPGFLIRHSRYAILVIFLLAAVITPTPDIINMSLFALPMSLLFYLGIFAGYLLVLKREHRAFPWGAVIKIGAGVILLVGAVLYLAISKYGYKLVPHWPFLTR
jgi:sec-independent protein translocase protein TatC